MEGPCIKVVVGTAQPVALKTSQALLAKADGVVYDALVAVEGRHDVFTADQAAEMFARGAELEAGPVVQALDKHQMKF
jgi:hypothetical protein